MPWTPLPRIAFAIATRPFTPTTPDDLPLELGDELYIIESCANSRWYRGYLVAPPSLLSGLTSTNGRTLEARVFSGIFPAACVDVKEYLTTEVPLAPEDAPDERVHKSSRRPAESLEDDERGSGEGGERERPPAPVPMLKVGDETGGHETEPLVDEIASCLREWHAANLHELLLARKYPLLEEIDKLVNRLDLARQQLLGDVLTRRELEKTREETVWSLVRGNKLLSREIVVRDPKSGRILTGEDSAVDITRFQSVMALLDEPPVKGEEGKGKFHLMLEHRNFAGTTTDPVTLVFYLATKENRPVSEGFTVELNSGVMTAQAKNQCLFIDIGTKDTEELYLVVRVYTNVVLTSGAAAESNGDAVAPSAGGTIKSRSSHGPPSASASKEHRLKGRVSVLFGSQKGRPGKEEDRRNGSSRSDNGTNSSPRSPTSSHSQNGSTPSIVPHLTQKKTTIKKALGVGVLEVGKFVTGDAADEKTLEIFTPPALERHTSKGSPASPAIDWDAFVKDVLDAQSGKSPSMFQQPLGGSMKHRHRMPSESSLRLPPEKNSAIDKIDIYLRPFIAEDADALISSMPTVLQQAVPSRKLGFTGAPTKPRSDIYITLNSAMIPKHAMMLQCKSGTAPAPFPPASQFSHLQVTMEVRRPNGEKIKDCVFPAANRPGTTVFKSTVVGRDETWSQTVRLQLEEEDVSDAHVYITLAGVPSDPVVIAWFPLWDQEAFLKDGEHDLLLYKLDRHTALPAGDGNQDSGYIRAPWTTSHEGWAGALSMGGAAASLKVHTYLCSTRFSQDDVLLSLLRWKSLKKHDLLDTLRKVSFVPEMEIVKQLRQVFDALFQVVVEHAQNAEIEDLVFFALITVLGIVYDRRFNMEPIVDEYTATHFNYPFATPCLLRSFTRLLNDPSHTENSVRLRAAFKVGKHIFRFIIIAREKQVLKEATIGINGSQSFARDLQNVFKQLENLMRNPDPKLVGSQTLAVQHFASWLPELKGVLGREDVLLIAIDFMDACEGVKGKLVLYKLVLIVHYSRSKLFVQPEERRALTVNTVRWLEPHWGKTEEVNAQYRDQVRLCCSVLAEQVDELGEEVSEYVPKVVASYRHLQSIKSTAPKETFSFLFPKTYPFPTSKPMSKPVVFDEALAELSAILAAMSNIPSALHLALAEEELEGFLMDTLKVHMSILSGEAFPKDWLSVHIYHHKSTMRTLETLAGILVDGFLPDPDDAEKFVTELWQAFFETLLMLVGSDALALETFPEQKRRTVWKVAGDVREQGADLLRRTWEAIGWETSDDERTKFAMEKMGGYQVQYVPGLVAPIVELCLSVHEGLRRVAVEVLQTMIVSEWSLNGDLTVVQAEMIDSLDRLFKSRKLTESFTQKLFIADLIELFKPLSQTPGDPLSLAVAGLLRTMDEFLDLLVAVHNVPMGEAYHIMDTLRLMDFLKDMRKEDMFIRYVHQLVNIQLSSNNLIEAALSLRLHADLYTWDVSEKVPALEDPAFPEQTPFERREQLFLEMISYFEDGKSWENALDVYRELGEQYESTLFDYAKLAKCHRAMAKLQDLIVENKPVIPNFYRVAYYGLGFPPQLRDRAFIVQAGPKEGHQSFADRMLMLHPTARLVDGQIDSEEGQFLHITPVVPHIDYSHPVFRKNRVSPNIRDRLIHRRIRAFATPPNQNAEPHITAWTEKTVYLAESTFPAILRRTEIVEAVDIIVYPAERAIANTLLRTAELSDLERRFAESTLPAGSLDIGPFTIALTAAVDANKSIAHYRDLLEDQATKPEIREALRTAMLDHITVIRKALATHNRIVPDALRPVQTNCQRCFEATFRPELAVTESLTPALNAPGQWRKHAESFSSSRDMPTPVTQPSEEVVAGRPRAGSRVPSRSRPPVMPPVPEGETVSKVKSAASSLRSVETRGSRKSRPSSQGEGKGVGGSIRRRWSQLKLAGGGKREKEKWEKGGKIGEVEEVGGY